MSGIGRLSLDGFFLQSLQQLNRSYGGLFESEIETDDSGSTGNENGTTSDYYERCEWFIILDYLSNHDRTKWDYYLNMNVIAFLNTLSFYKMKEQELERKRELERMKWQSRNPT